MNTLRVAHLDRAGTCTSIGSLFTNPSLPLVLKAKVRQCSKVQVPGLVRAWTWIRREALLSWHRPDAQASMKVAHSLNNPTATQSLALPDNFSWQDWLFYPALTHFFDYCCSLLSHTDCLTFRACFLLSFLAPVNITTPGKPVHR